jgi:hypothetical protein
MLISSYEYDLPSDDYYSKIVNSLDGIDLTPDKVADLPALIFMLPAFMTEDTAENVTAVVEQLSATYFVTNRDRLDLLTCSTILMGWSRSYCHNQDLLD